MDVREHDRIVAAALQASEDALKIALAKGAPAFDRATTGAIGSAEAGCILAAHTATRIAIQDIEAARRAYERRRAHRTTP